MINRLLFAAVLALVALPACALDEGFITQRKLDPRLIGSLAELIHKEMTAPDGRFVYVDDAEQARVEAALAEMQQILAGKESVAALSEDERVALINAQETANAILTKRDGERLICSRRPIVGSHRRETTCETYAEQMMRKERGIEHSRMLSQPKSCLVGTPGGEAGFCPQESALNRVPGRRN